MATACFEGSKASANPSPRAVVARVGKKEGKNDITASKRPVRSPFTAPRPPPAKTATTTAIGQGQCLVIKRATNVLDNPTTPTTDRSTSAQIRHIVIAALITISGQLTLMIANSVVNDTNWLLAIPNAATNKTR